MPACRLFQKGCGGSLPSSGSCGYLNLSVSRQWLGLTHEGREGMIPQGGYYPSLGNTNCRFHFGLISWLADTGRYHHSAIIFYEVMVCRINFRFIPAWLGNSAFKLSGTTISGTPPKNAKAFTWASIQEGRSCFRLAQTKV